MTGRDFGEQRDPGGPGHGVPGFGPPPPAFDPGGRSRPPARRPAVLIAAVVAAVLLVGGGVYAATLAGDDGRDTAGKPTAQGSDPATPSATPSVDKGDGDGPGGGPETYDPNAGIKAGEAPVWVVANRTELTRSGATQHGPWRVGDAVVRAMYREVVAHAVTDGKEKWKVSLETPMCGVPQAPAAGGKLVVAVLESTSKGAHCTHLQQIDLTTGKTGWKTEVPQENPADRSLELQLAISGDTVAAARSAVMSGFSVTDGRKLFGTSKTGNCFPTGVGGGARLLVLRGCPEPDRPGGGLQAMIEEADPLTGAPKWSHRYEKGWTIGRALSVDPLVVAAYHSGQKVWSITAFAPDGKVRSRTEPKFGVTGRCNGWGDGTNGLHYCHAAAADADTLYLAAGKAGRELGIDTTDEVVAVDLNTGQEKWRAAAPKGRAMWPLAVADGKVTVYLAPATGQAAAVATLPTAGGAPQVVLQSPAAAAGAEAVFYPFHVRVAWSEGRLFLLKGSVTSPEAKKVDHALLSFGRQS